MGRLSALILQAVCLAGWLTERQADAYVIGDNREDGGSVFAGTVLIPREKKSSGLMTPGLWLRASDSLRFLSLWSRSNLLEERDISQLGAAPDHLTHHQAGDRCLFLSLGHDWWKEGTAGSGSVTTWNNPYSVVQWCEGVTFSITGDTWKTPCSIALTTGMNPTRLPGRGVRVEWHLVFLCLCSSGWCRLIVAQECVCVCVCVWVCVGGAKVDGGIKNS